MGCGVLQIFTDELPFKSYDAMELVYSHMAKPPPSPKDFNPELPEQIANIILKLLSKKAEERIAAPSVSSMNLERCKGSSKLRG